MHSCTVDFVFVTGALDVGVSLTGSGACRAPLPVTSLSAMLVNAQQVCIVGVHIGNKLKPRVLFSCRPGPDPLGFSKRMPPLPLLCEP